MAWERELQVLEEAIHRVNAEYDAFLYGSASKPPSDSRKRVEQMIRRLSGVTFDAAADRYKFTTLQGRYAALVERWDRLQGEKESGRRPGLYGHFVPGASGSFAGTSFPTRSPSPNAAASASVEQSEERAGVDRRVYEAYVAARRARGESMDAYSFEAFAQGLARERARLKERLGTEDVVFEVGEREGKVKLIAKRRDAGAGPVEKK